ncbi:UDP-N-acetylglucosamine 2-epimerase (hydrolyzing) [Candidatus Peregrinibacteria bacterium]|nr:UDP-N-acetylglucosamine 2-epimerase (hydrolyzing) [Candidatus Peregrinibacteria bacterium]
MKKKKIAYVTCTRTDYGLMLPVLQAVQNSPELELKLYYSGLHLMKKFGNTQAMVKKDFPAAKLVKGTFKSDNRFGVTEFIGTFIKNLAASFAADRPDFVLNIGDRPEVLAIATVCVYLGIPSGHLHGGDKSSTVDEIARHAITKLSHLHFPATKDAATRIKKMGEEPWRIHVCGAPALDYIMQEKLLTRKELCADLHLDPKSQFILILQHPASENYSQSGEQMRQTIAAAKTFKLPIVIIYPNGDPGSRAMINIIQKEKDNSLFRIFTNLEYKKFLTLEKEAAVWLSNSSAAMIESSSFKTPVVNIGNRQDGRLHGNNVIHAACKKDEIMKAIEKSLFDKTYLKSLKTIKNPWGQGKAGKRIAQILAEIELNQELLYKKITF